MAGLISRETIDAVESATDIVAVVGEYTKLERRGSDWWGCCPFHNEKTPSFHVIPDRNMYYCFGCHAAGGAIKFIQEMEKISFTDAVRQLAGRAGIALTYTTGTASAAPEDTSRDELISFYDRVASLFHYLLTEDALGAAALTYISGRGITPETVRRFKLGFAPADRTWLKRFLLGKNFSPEFLARSGLFSAKYPDSAFFSDRLM
ncbi:MAG: DNA primase, partial [Treponema sp.]|nr:DNA primase [Treponema sp.]